MPPPDPHRPYAGLRPYDESLQDYFFGRERDANIIISNLFAERLTIVYGSSGVGKSSLLMAGVSPGLSRRNTAAVVVFRDWKSPAFFAELKARCLESVSNAAGKPAPVPPTLALDELLIQARLHLGGPIFILLDQFEEYLLNRPAPPLDDPFENELARAINSDSPCARFLISIRDDWLSKLDRFRGRIPNLLRTTIQLRHLDRADAERTIRQPLEVHNTKHPESAPVHIENELVQEVLDQVRSGRVVLESSGAGHAEALNAETRVEAPFLQLVMTRLWDEDSNSKTLRLATFQRLGGAAAIVRAHLDDVMNGLSESQRVMCAAMFRYLVTPTGIKIAQATGDLVRYAQRSESEVRSLLEALTARRILNRLDNPERYEILHDVLSAPVLDWRTRYEKARQARSKRRWRLAALGLGIYFLVTATVFVLYRIERARAQASRSREVAGAALRLLEEDPELSVLLAMEAVAITKPPTMEAIEALTQATQTSRVRLTLSGHDDSLEQVAYGPDGARLATASRDKTVRIWEPASGRSALIIRGHGGAVTGVAFSPDGTHLATTSEDGYTRLWDAGSGSQIWRRDFEPQATPVAVAFHPDGTLLLTGHRNGSVSLLDAGNGNVVRSMSGHEGAILRVAFRSDGKRFATASADGKAKVWETAWGSRQPAPVLRVSHADQVLDASFNRDGRLLETAGLDHVVKVWDASSGEVAFELPVQANPVQNAAFSTDGSSRLAIGGWDGSASVWELIPGQEARMLFRLRGHKGFLSSLAFSPDGKRLATASHDRTAKVWEMQSPDLLSVFAHNDQATKVAFRPDGQRLAASAMDGSVKVWETRTGEQLLDWRAHELACTGVAFHPAGARLATSGLDRRAKIWNAATGDLVCSAPEQSGQVLDVAFSPDGTQLATASWDRTASLWDASSCALLKKFDHPDGVNDVAFTPDGKRLITAGLDHTVRSWDLATGQSVVSFSGHKGRTFCASVSPDGARVASASEDGIARVWDAAPGAGRLALVGHTNWVHSVVFNSDGTRLATAGRDGLVKLWDASSGAEVISLEGHRGMVMWAEFSPDGFRLASAGADKTVRLLSVRAPDTEKLLKQARAQVTRRLTAEECSKLLHSDSCR